jgi:flavin reductase (DIM6/NTAB) family NADH-FMN oxidoreductase RutF
MADIDTRKLRDVLGRYATGVAVITTRAQDGSHVGVTVNSFSSVSLEPPLILFSLLRRANVLLSFEQASSFVVNILSHDQQPLSNMFARPSSANWEDMAFSHAENGCALFSGSLAHLVCNKKAEFEGGDHIIFLGLVTNFHLCSSADPLLFFRGAYGTYTRDQWSKMQPLDSSSPQLSISGWG